MDQNVQKYQEVMAKIEKRLMDPRTTAKQARELKTIKTRMQIMGPGFMDASLARLRGMFDQEFL